MKIRSYVTSGVAVAGAGMLIAAGQTVVPALTERDMRVVADTQASLTAATTPFDSRNVTLNPASVVQALQIASSLSNQSAGDVQILTDSPEFSIRGLVAAYFTGYNGVTPPEDNPPGGDDPDPGPPGLSAVAFYIIDHLPLFQGDADEGFINGLDNAFFLGFKGSAPGITGVAYYIIRSVLDAGASVPTPMVESVLQPTETTPQTNPEEGGQQVGGLFGGHWLRRSVQTEVDDQTEKGNTQSPLVARIPEKPDPIEVQTPPASQLPNIDLQLPKPKPDQLPQAPRLFDIKPKLSGDDVMKRGGNFGFGTGRDVSNGKQSDDQATTSGTSVELPKPVNRIKPGTDSGHPHGGFGLHRDKSGADGDSK